MRGPPRLARGVLVLAALALSAAAPCALAQDPAASDTAASSAPPAQAEDAVVQPRPAPSPPPAAPPPAPTARLQPSMPIPPAELEALVDGAVRQAMTESHLAGVTVSVVQNGQTVLKKGYGVASLSPARPVDPDTTLFRIGSISKLFTWMLVMKEVEHGRMRLDGPVNQYLPEILQVRDQGYARPVELRDLMTDSAGFEDKVLGRLFERDPGRVRPLAKYLRQEKPRRVRPAGELPEDSDYGAALAGEAVSQAAGKPFEDLVEAEIIRPLGLGHTTFREPYAADPALPAPMPPGLATQTAQGLRWTGAGFQPQPFEYVSQQAPAGSASSTAGDMARLMALVLGDGTLDGVSIYSPQTAAAFRTVTLRAGPGIAGWAAGFLERPMPGGFDGFGHEGGTLDFHSNLVTVPALGLGVFVAADSDGAGDLVESLPRLIVARFYAAPSAPPASADANAERAAYAGTYLSEKRRYGGLEQFIALLADTVKIDIDDDGRLAVTGARGGRTFVPAGAAGQVRDADTGEPAGFQMEGGVARRWLPPDGSQTYERIGPWLYANALGLVAAAALTAAAATLTGLMTRDRRDFRETPVQGRASALQTSTAVLWLLAAGGFVSWAVRAKANPSLAFWEWPGPWVMVASSCALVAAIGSASQVLLLPAVWRGGRRVDSWTGWRKLRFTMTALLFLAFGVLLALWGALEPWSA